MKALKRNKQMNKKGRRNGPLAHTQAHTYTYPTYMCLHVHIQFQKKKL